MKSTAIFLATAAFLSSRTSHAQDPQRALSESEVLPAVCRASSYIELLNSFHTPDEARRAIALMNRCVQVWSVFTRLLAARASLVAGDTLGASTHATLCLRDNSESMQPGIRNAVHAQCQQFLDALSRRQGPTPSSTPSNDLQRPWPEFVLSCAVPAGPFALFNPLVSAITLGGAEASGLGVAH